MKTNGHEVIDRHAKLFSAFVRKLNMSKKDKIYATKKWLIEQSGNEAYHAGKDAFAVHDAMQAIVDAFALCAVANHYSGGCWFSKTPDGMEWAFKFEKFGKRNPKTGKIDKRIKRVLTA